LDVKPGSYILLNSTLLNDSNKIKLFNCNNELINFNDILLPLLVKVNKNIYNKIKARIKSSEHSAINVINVVFVLNKDYVRNI